MDQIRILGIAGSLRTASYGGAVLRAANNLTSPDLLLEIYDLKDLPVFNQDMELSLPGAAKNFKSAISRSDGILFVTPEYNYSVPGVLKNAIDWASRPFGDNSWDNKPAAIISYSPGMLGGSRALYHLRQVGVSLNLHFLNRPEVIIPQVKDKIDDQGNLVDTKTRDKIRELLTALRDWTIKIR